jgi:hypothetical protein
MATNIYRVYVDGFCGFHLYENEEQDGRQCFKETVS